MSYLTAYKIFSLLLLIGLLLLWLPLHAASRRVKKDIEDLEAQTERDDACGTDA